MSFQGARNLAAAAVATAIASGVGGCGGGSRLRHVAAPERRPRGYARRVRFVDRRGHRRPPPRALALPLHRPRRASRASSRRRRSPTATRSTCRTCAATSSRSTARTVRCAGSIASARGTTGRTGSRSTAAASTAPPTPTPSRSRRTPASCSGAGTSTSQSEQFVDVAPVAWKDLVFTSTVGYAPFGRGAIYALDAATGAVRWKFDTIKEPWRSSARGGRRRALVPGLGRRARAALRGHLEPDAVGRHARRGRTAPRSPARCRTPTRCSCSTPARAGCSGTTR